MSENNQSMSNLKAIRTFFEDGGRKCTMEELKALSPADREELGQLCREALAEDK